MENFIQYNSESSKLAELSAKTDRQLITLISSRLDRGLTFARLLANEESRSNWGSLEEFYRKAENAYAEVLMWLPWVRARADRGRLEAQAALLRAMLDQQSTGDERRVQTACS